MYGSEGDYDLGSKGECGVGRKVSTKSIRDLVMVLVVGTIALVSVIRFDAFKAYARWSQEREG